jgi:erythronate-4-phosphate dehydrogenase
MTLTIVADENIPAVEHYLGPKACVRRVNGRQITAAQLAGVDALLVRSVTPVHEELLHGSAVRFVGTATSGVDHIDRHYLQSQGIGFAHAPGSNANSVVEYVLAAIARVPGKLEQLLAGGRVGIGGYGVIGKAVAARLKALGINYCVYDPWLQQDSIEYPVNLEDILDCDVVTLHPELTREKPWPSFHLLGTAELATLDSKCLLINASRGAVVDNQALLQCLRTGRGPTTVLDVWEGEPRLNPQLLALAELGTAHIAGYSLDGKLLATRMLCEALARHSGLVLPHIDSPAGQPQALVLPAGLAGAELMRYLLQARYDIVADDALLRAAMQAADAEQAGRAFDQLRKHYGQRRELLGSTVHAQSLSQEDIKRVQALGCTLVAGEAA